MELFKKIRGLMNGWHTENSSEVTKQGTITNPDFIQKSNFDFSLLANLQAENGEKNICISPVSFKIVLLLLYCGINKDTLKALNINIESIDSLTKYIRSLLGNLNYSVDGVKLNCINAIWINSYLEKSSCDDCFDIVRKLKLSEVNYLDFSQSDETCKAINNWVYDNTNGKIDSIIIPDEINKNLTKLISNAIYFKGKWKDSFEKKNTMEKDFFTTKQSVKCQMMSKFFDTSYFESDEYQSIKVPYKRYASMYIFLPNKNICIADFIKNLQMSDIDKKISEMCSREGILDLPRFKTNFEVIVPVLDNPEFGVIKQKTFIELDEEGTEAAAVTLSNCETACFDRNKPKPFKMVLDRPFLYMIIDDNSKETLFMGIINDPNKL